MAPGTSSGWMWNYSGIVGNTTTPSLGSAREYARAIVDGLGKLG